MNKEIILTPEELYYLGSFLQARYIDYAYVAAMADIRQDYKLFEKETKASLVASDVLVEDFSGNIEIDDTVRGLLNPIFFGERETSLDICEVGEESTIKVYRFHFHDGVITMVSANQGKLLLQPVDPMRIRSLVEQVLPKNYDVESRIITEEEEITVRRYIVAKCNLISITSVVKAYFEADGVVYQEDEENVKSVSKDEFIADICEIIGG